MGAVYEAIDERVSCLVAVKETLVGTSQSSREAFQREAALLANLRHPLLPKVMDYFGEGDGEFLVMEFIAGNDLLELLKLRGGPLPQLEVLKWGIEILKLLEHLHSHEPPILHRDIKPANLKATSSGELFLLDFGLAKGATGQMITVETDRSVPGYTPVYSPLEQILGQGTDARSDIYAVGATLYHLLTAKAPASAAARFSANENNQTDPLKPANQLNIDITPEVSLCIQNAMQLSRKTRTSSARDMRIELERAVKTIENRDVIRKAEQDLLDKFPQAHERDSDKPLVVDEGVQFTVYSPEKIKPKKSYTMLAFAHLTRRPDDADPDDPDPLEEVKTQANRLLANQPADYRDVKESSTQAVPRGGEITFIPFVAGLTFNPPSRSFTWRKSVHREEFDVSASPEVDGQTLNGSMTVFLGSVVIAEVGLSLSVDSNATPAKEKISLDQAKIARRVKQVFASYSNKDEQVVAELAQVAPIFGSRFLLDRTHLEPGEDRAEGLKRLIRDADVFQLFWSNNSMRSSEIVDEIKYAAGLGRPGFILPTYWEEPVPRSPEENLPPPEIDKLQFYRIYPGALTQTMIARPTGTKVVVVGPQGAEVYIDDERQGSIGSSGRVILGSIPTGHHVVRITHSIEGEDERVIDIKAGQAEQTITASFRSARITSAAPIERDGEFSIKASAPIARRAPRDTGELAIGSPASAPTDELPSEPLSSPAPSWPTMPSPSAYSASRVGVQSSVTICPSCGMNYYDQHLRFCPSCGSMLEKKTEVKTVDASPMRVDTMQTSAPLPQASGPANYSAPPVPESAGGMNWKIMTPIFAGVAMVFLVVVLAPVWYLMKTQTASSNPVSYEPTPQNSNTSANVNRSANVGIVPSTVDLEFVNVSGRSMRLSDFRGKVVLLNFWSTTNTASLEQIQALNDVQRAYGGRGVVVIGLSTRDSAEKIRQFQSETPQEYTVGVAGDGLPTKLSLNVLPTTYVIDQRGQVVKKLTGVQNQKILETAVELWLSEGQ